MKYRSIPAILLIVLASFSIAFAQGGPMGRMGQAAPTAADKAKLDKLEKEYNAAKAKLAKAPKDKKAQKNFTDIGGLYGHEVMLSPVLGSKVKYRKALHIYREVLKVDPKQPVAKADSDQIISIYQSLGRPIPKD